MTSAGGNSTATERAELLWQELVQRKNADTRTAAAEELRACEHPETPELRIAKAQAHLSAVERDVALRHAETALSEAHELSPTWRARGLTILAQCLALRGDLDAALRTCREGYEPLGYDPREALDERMAGTTLEGNIHTRRGDFAQAIRCFLEVVSIGERYPQPIDTTVPKINLANSWSRIGDYDSALREYEALLEKGDIDETPVDKALCLANLAAVLGRLDRHEDSLQKFGEVLELVDDPSLPVVANAQYGRASLLRELGRLPEARRAAEASCDARSGRPDVDQAYGWLGIGWVEFDCEEYERALAHFETAAQLLDLAEAQDCQLTTLTGLAHCHARLGDTSEAIELANRARALVGQATEHHAREKTLGRLKTIYKELGQWDRALESAEQHHELVRETLRNSAQTRLEVQKVELALDEARSREELILRLHDEAQEQLKVRTDELLETRQTLNRALHSIDSSATAPRSSDESLQRQQRLEIVGEIASSFAHDLNNLLTIISVCTSELSSAPPERRSEIADEVALAVDQAAFLSRHLLSAGKSSPPRQESLSLASILDELERLVRPILRSKVQFVKECTETAPLVLADRHQLLQVLMNLALNARDAMPDGGTLSVGTVAGDSSESVEIVVRDTGTGIPVRLQEKIFEAFFTTKVEGTGLGLSICRDIIEKNHGSLSFVSEPNRGTEFRIRLPSANDRAAETRVATDRSSDERLEVLLVEVDNRLRGLMSNALERAGYSVVSTDSGSLALRQVETRRREFAAVIADRNLPEVDGLTLYHALRSKDADTRFVLTSGVRHETRVGDSDPRFSFLPKPFTPLRLVSTLEQMESTSTEC